MKKSLLTILLALSLVSTGCASSANKTVSDVDNSSVEQVNSVVEEPKDEQSEQPNNEIVENVASDVQEETEEEIVYETAEKDNIRGLSKLSVSEIKSLESLIDNLYTAELNDPTMNKNYTRSLEEVTNDIFSTCDVYGYEYACDYTKQSIEEHELNAQNYKPAKKTYEDKDNIDYYIINMGFLLEDPEVDKYIKYCNISTIEDLWDHVSESYKQRCRKAFKDEWRRETNTEFNPVTYQMGQEIYDCFTSGFFK